MDLIEDDNIHMLSWDDGLLESIILDNDYEVDTVGFSDFYTVQFDFKLGTI